LTTPPGNNVAVDVAAPRAKTFPLASMVPAEQLVTQGKLRPLVYEPGAVSPSVIFDIYGMSQDDPDVTFALNRQWEWFEVQIRLRDPSQAKATGISGWFDDNPRQRAFHFQLSRAQPRASLRLRIADATRLTIAPTYPGYPLILVNPRFIRKQ
jgi:hypothetical protein